MGREWSLFDNSLFKFTKVTDTGNKNSDIILLEGPRGVAIESHLNP